MKNYSLVIYNNLILTAKDIIYSTDMLRKTFEKRTPSFPKGFSSVVTTRN